MEMTTAYLSLGGNTGDVLTNLKKAIEFIGNTSNIQLQKVSPFYKTSPISPLPQPDFINAICSIQTSLSPLDLLKQLQKIEAKLGKVPKPKEAPRPIDIDIVFYGSTVYNDAELTIPHPCWKERLFVLVPLADLISTVTIEGAKIQQFTIKDLIQVLTNQPQQLIHLLDDYYAQSSCKKF